MPFKKPEHPAPTKIKDFTFKISWLGGKQGDIQGARFQFRLLSAVDEPTGRVAGKLLDELDPAERAQLKGWIKSLVARAEGDLFG